MKVERVFWIVLVITLALLVFSFRGSDDGPTKYLPGDTVFTYVNIPIPEPYDTIIYDTDTLWLPGMNDTIEITDTVFVYNDYFKMYNYQIDTVINEVDINTKVKITQNRLYEYNISAKNNRKTAVIIPRRNNLGIGVVAGVDLMAPVATYEFKNHEIGLGYNVLNQSPVLTYQYKFRFRNNE